MDTVILKVPSVMQLSDEQFFQLCLANRDLKFERTATGDLVIMSPTGGSTSRRNADINLELALWNRQTQLGVVFDSSGGFKLPNGADRSPDAAWIPLEKWNALTPEQQEKFLPVAPDFVIELRSPTDSLKLLQAKMLEYINAGTRLGWLINRQDCQVEIYRPNQEVEILDNPITLSGENILPEFVLNLERIW
jgi:Uma2 family endonuclease